MHFEFEGNPSYEKDLTWYGDLKPYARGVFNGKETESFEEGKVNVVLQQSNISRTNNLNIEILTDDFGEEIYWAIINEDRSVIADGGNQAVGQHRDIFPQNFPTPIDSSAYGANELINIDVHIPKSGCYKLIVNDYANNGMCCDFGEGYFKISSLDNAAIIELDEDFKEKVTIPFRIDPLSSSIDFMAQKIKIFPNPLQGKLNIEASQAIDHIIVFNQVGQEVYRNDVASSEKATIDIGFLNTGMFFLRLQTKSGETMVQKFVKQ